jgi:hypothetical protein
MSIKLILKRKVDIQIKTVNIYWSHDLFFRIDQSCKGLKFSRSRNHFPPLPQQYYYYTVYAYRPLIQHAPILWETEGTSGNWEHVRNSVQCEHSSYFELDLKLELCSHMHSRSCQQMCMQIHQDSNSYDLTTSTAAMSSDNTVIEPLSNWNSIDNRRWPVNHGKNCSLQVTKLMMIIMTTINCQDTEFDLLEPIIKELQIIITAHTFHHCVH